MPQKTDRYAALAADLLRELAAFDASLLDDPGDLAQQEATRVKLVADFLRGAMAGRPSPQPVTGRSPLPAQPV
jgi:hypothetical protein